MPTFLLIFWLFLVKGRGGQFNPYVLTGMEYKIEGQQKTANPSWKRAATEDYDGLGHL